MSDSDSADEFANVEENDAPSSDDEPPEPPIPPDKPSRKFFIQHSKSYYEVSETSDVTVAGITRIYPEAERVYVESGERLGSLVTNSFGAWPKGELLCGNGDMSLIQYCQIVVLQGRLNKDDQVLSHSWYVIFEVDGMFSDDKFILRHIPRPIYKEIQRIMAQDPAMAGSALNAIKADKENDKPLSPSYNPEFVKVSAASAPHSLCVFPDKKPSKPKEDKKKESKETKEDKKKESSEKEAKEKESTEKDSKERESAGLDQCAPKKSVASLWQNPVGPAEEPLPKPCKPDKAPKPVQKASKPDKADKADKPDKAEKAEKASKPEKLERPSEECGNACKQASAPSIEKRSNPDDGEESEERKILYKRKRLSITEEEDVVICDSAASFTVSGPPGATRAKLSTTWFFD